MPANMVLGFKYRLIFKVPRVIVDKRVFLVIGDFGLNYIEILVFSIFLLILNWMRRSYH